MQPLFGSDPSRLQPECSALILVVKWSLQDFICNNLTLGLM
jgi:hypothetical protein